MQCTHLLQTDPYLNLPLPSLREFSSTVRHSNTNLGLKNQGCTNQKLSGKGQGTQQTQHHLFFSQPGYPTDQIPQHCSAASLSMAPSKPNSTMKIITSEGKGCINRVIKDNLREQTKPQHTFLAAPGGGGDLCRTLWERFRKTSRAVSSKRAV